MKLGNAWQRKKPILQNFPFLHKLMPFMVFFMALDKDYHKEWYIPD